MNPAWNCLVLLAVLASSPDVSAASWSLSVSDQDGLPYIARDGAPAVKSHYAFWGANWKWADQHTDFRIIGPYEYAVSGRNPTLNADLSARISRPAVGQLLWEFDLEARSTVADAIGGGVVFKFDLDAFAREMGEPELLPHGQGWSWGRPGQNRIVMRFDPPLASIHFEKGRKSDIRALFHHPGVRAGKRRIKAVVEVSGDIRIDKTAGERFGPSELRAWQTDILDWRNSPVDLSFLNDAEKPAGKRGYIKASGDMLVFEDGTPGRFWGTNLTAAALFGTPKDAVRQQAKRLSRLGFNLVRLHHHDSVWVTPNIFGDDKAPNTLQPSPAMQEKLDWWIKSLKDEGIYVWLDLHVQRHVKAGDNIDHFQEIAGGKTSADLKGYSYVNDNLRQAMKRFNERYVGHVNQFTGKAYKDEPAIIAMLITNENDVTQHFGNALLPDKKVPRHSEIYMRMAASFAERHRLPGDKVWRSWEHGPSKLFLNELESRFNAEMLAHLRELGVRVPIATTSSWGSNPLSSLPALTLGDIIDVHSYGAVEDIGMNPLHQPNLVSWMAAAQVPGKPLSVTEWNAGRFPAADRHGLPLYVAASAGMQGWDAMMQYAYSQIPLNSAGYPSNWLAYNDPALMATMPAAALLYRQKHVREASSVYAFAPTPEQLFGAAMSPASSVALRTAVDRGKLLIALPKTRELPWLQQGLIPKGARAISDPAEALIAADATVIDSDNGELQRDWGNGVFTVNTPFAKVATGWIGGRTLDLGEASIRVTTRNASVAVQSLDRTPIMTSRRILISLGARSLPETAKGLPFHSEPVTGELSIRAAPGLTLYALRTAAGGAERIAAPYVNGKYMISLGPALKTYWLQLRP